jgi:hypothetical protein
MLIRCVLSTQCGLLKRTFCFATADLKVVLESVCKKTNLHIGAVYFFHVEDYLFVNWAPGKKTSIRKFD